MDSLYSGIGGCVMTSAPGRAVAGASPTPVSSSNSLVPNWIDPKFVGGNQLTVEVWDIGSFDNYYFKTDSPVVLGKPVPVVSSGWTFPLFFKRVFICIAILLVILRCYPL
jgi:hypothetical protein